VKSVYAEDTYMHYTVDMGTERKMSATTAFEMIITCSRAQKSPVNLVYMGRSRKNGVCRVYAKPCHDLGGRGMVVISIVACVVRGPDKHSSPHLPFALCRCNTRTQVWLPSANFQLLPLMVVLDFRHSFINACGRVNCKFVSPPTDGFHANSSGCRNI
jgi:hypothetical protein